QNGGVLVTPLALTFTNRDLIVALAARLRLPAIYPLAFYAKAGGLISYGFDPVIQFQQAAGYVDRILRGAKPADLPVQYPTKLQLVINLKTAKALGLAIPESFLCAPTRSSNGPFVLLHLLRSPLGTFRPIAAPQHPDSNWGQIRHPVEQPTRFDLAINLITAKALGLTVPPVLLARADEVIE